MSWPSHCQFSNWNFSGSVQKRPWTPEESFPVCSMNWSAGDPIVTVTS